MSRTSSVHKPLETARHPNSSHRRPNRRAQAAEVLQANFACLTNAQVGSTHGTRTMQGHGWANRGQLKVASTVQASHRGPASAAGQGRRAVQLHGRGPKPAGEAKVCQKGVMMGGGVHVSQ